MKIVDADRVTEKLKSRVTNDNVDCFVEFKRVLDESANEIKSLEPLKELIELIQQRPELPIVPMVDSEVVCDDGYARWLGSWGSAYIEKYCLNDEEYIVYEEDEIVDIFEKVFDYKECGIDEEMPDEVAIPIMKEKVDSLPWVEAIIVNIDLPN